jgi:hypothetical protein
MAFKILQLDPSLAFAENSQGRTALEVLAKKPFAVGSKSSISAWETCFYSSTPVSLPPTQTFFTLYMCVCIYIYSNYLFLLR